MIINAIYAIGSSVIISLIAIIGALPLIIKKNVPQKFLTVLLSISVGTLLGSAFIQLIPEAASHGFTLSIPIYIMVGFITFFLLEKFIHSNHEHHSHHHGKKHSHGYCLGILNVFGDAVHNFIDGLVIGSMYMISIPLGISATISIAFHELPQEIADFGILLYSGFSKKKAMFYNFLSAVTAVVGTIIGILLTNKLTNFNEFILPFTAGIFLYIGASNLVPELHKNCSFKESLFHVFAILMGFSIIALVTILGPGHVHG